VRKLARLPDGIFRERTYVECSAPGDRGTYRVCLEVEKRGDKLIFRNDGTASQQGGINATYSGWRGSMLVALNELMCWDQYFSVGGALRHCEFDPTPGTLNCADFPASVSTAPVQAMEISLYPAYNVLSKLIYSDPQMRADIMCIGGTSQWPATVFRGIDQWGERFGYILVDPIGGAIGAFAHADGISTGGQSRTPICKLPNVEHTEQSFPVLFLYRKEVTDSGGAGRWRGGLSAESCFVAHGTEAIVHDTLSSGNAVPTAPGMMAGYPGAVNRYRFLRGSDVGARFEASHLPGDVDELQGTAEMLQLRQQNFVQRPGDVYAVLWSAAAGFGDPLERDPERVAADVAQEAVSPQAARDTYGVILAPDGEADRDATRTQRAALRASRLARASAPAGGPQRLPGDVRLRVTENLTLRDDGAAARFACAGCAADLGPASGNYKAACARFDAPIEAANPIIGDPARFIDARPVFRQFYCPSCGRLIENEVALATEALLRDIELAP
jgi:N-methylhydantoinase B